MAVFWMLSFLVVFGVGSQAFTVPGEVFTCGTDGNFRDLYPARYVSGVTFRSYNFGVGQYRNYENCTARFWAEEQNLQLTVQFNSFDIETQPQCQWDSFCINGAKLCGSWPSAKKYVFLVPAKKSFTLVFTSDSSVVKPGFEILITAQVAQNLTDQYEIASGYGSQEYLVQMKKSNLNTYEDRCEKITSYSSPEPWDNYSQNYSYSSPNYQYNNSTYRSSPNYQYSNSTYRSSPNYQYNNSTYRSSPNYQYSNSTYRSSPNYQYSNSTYRSSSNYQYNSTYRSSPNYQYNNSTYRSSPNVYGGINSTDYPYSNFYNGSIAPLTPASRCGLSGTIDVDAANTKYILRSGRDEIGRYWDNQRCSVVFRTSSKPQVFTVTFNSMYLENQEQCSYDSVCVRGVPFCGTWAGGYTFIYLVPAYNTFTVGFKTDGSVTDDGFEIQVETREGSPNTIVYEPSAGFGSAENRLVFEKSNLQNYYDKCASNSNDFYTPNYYYNSTGSY